MKPDESSNPNSGAKLLPPLKNVICSLWLITGLSLGAWCVRGSVNARFRSVVEANLIGVGFAVFVLVGALLGLMNRRGGTLLLKGVAGLAILYAVVFVLLEGFQDRGSLYAVSVAALAALAVATFVVLRPKALR
jgi:hypothetical protein